jgi:hypothetical protein
MGSKEEGIQRKRRTLSQKNSKGPSPSRKKRRQIIFKSHVIDRPPRNIGLIYQLLEINMKRHSAPTNCKQHMDTSSHKFLKVLISWLKANTLLAFLIRQEHAHP